LELAGELEIAGPSVHDHIKQLVRKGYIRREPGKARGLTVLRRLDDEVTGLVPVPLVGTVAAGKPVLAEENLVGEVLVEENLAKSGRCFALKVRGDSMTKAKIHHADLVVVRQQQLAESGDIVVALVDDEATIKRLHIRDQQIELRPESKNKKHRPIVIGPDMDLRIVGKVVGVRRPMKA
jgi:repressor LexA